MMNSEKLIQNMSSYKYRLFEVSTSSYFLFTSGKIIWINPGTIAIMLSIHCLLHSHFHLKGTNGRQKTNEIFHVYCIFYSGFMCQTTVIFGITKDGSLVLNTLAS